ncbi:MAG: EAL domain-containing protein [Hahellaceae bacterium]|nr:EAL domain-containing protein [Hahellaceae bacterium]MCP5169687.1 EAL domain-containing protein [Hahellaceae bacterium]
MTPRLLIVDDEPLARELLQGYIAGIELPLACDFASNGQEAIDMARQHEYFLIVLDYLMPVMDGFSCAKVLQETLKKPVPIIFVTGNAGDRVMQLKGYELGAIDYLQKPVVPEVFVSKVRMFLRLHQSQLADQKYLSDVLSKQESQQNLLDYAGEGILGFNNDLLLDYANVAACTLLTRSRDALMGMPLKRIMNPNVTEQAWWQSDFVSNFLDGQNMHSDSATFWRPDGDFFPVCFTQTVVISDGQAIGGLISFQDISERIILENRLESLVSVDQLTGLKNRRAFYELLEGLISNPQNLSSGFGVLLIDIDNFKSINDNFGHQCGDSVLVNVGIRLKEILPDGACASRLGGDEFAVFAPLSSTAELGTLASNIVSALKLPYFLHGKEIFSSVSVGVALYPEHASDLTHLMSAADTAMYLAKQTGKDSYALFDEKAQQQLKDKFRIAINLRRANYGKEFSLVYQPKFDLKSLTMAGAEALLRWHSPTLGEVAPGLFIPIAESIGYITEITQWALKCAIKDAKVWNENSRLNIPLRIAVNTSPLDLKRGTFVKQVLDAIYLDKLNPTWIELEVTESAVMDDPKAAIEVLTRLKQHGLRISVDDFGTGYSSLNYLKKLPLDYLKVDQSFVKDIGVDPSDEKIIKAIVQLAHSLDLKVIAEGIETVEQLRYLQALGCDYGQGFYLSKPVSADEIPVIFVQSQRRRV